MYVCTLWDSLDAECGGVRKEGISVLYTPEKRAIILIYPYNNIIDLFFFFD